MLRKSRLGRYGVYSFESYSIFLGNYQSQTCPNPFSIVSTRPSFTRIIRSVASATEGSCVTITIVSPSRFTLLSSSITSTVVLLSNAPVGSSAKITCGLAIRARAMATRCFCPPDISFGICSAQSFSPTISRYSNAIAFRFLRLTPW